MGWKNRVLSELNMAEEALAAVRQEMDKKKDALDLDEVCRSVIDLQKSAAEMLYEIYDSCGPFFTSSSNGPFFTSSSNNEKG